MDIKDFKVMRKLCGNLQQFANVLPIIVFHTVTMQVYEVIT